MDTMGLDWFWFCLPFIALVLRAAAPSSLSDLLPQHLHNIPGADWPRGACSNPSFLVHVVRTRSCCAATILPLYFVHTYTPFCCLLYRPESNHLSREICVLF